MPNCVSTAKTKEILQISNTGLRKIRALYRSKGLIQDRELFTVEQIEELKKIIAYQREHRRISFDDAFHKFSTLLRTISHH